MMTFEYMDDKQSILV